MKLFIECVRETIAAKTRTLMPTSAVVRTGFGIRERSGGASDGSDSGSDDIREALEHTALDQIDSIADWT